MREPVSLCPPGTGALAPPGIPSGVMRFGKETGLCRQELGCLPRMAGAARAESGSWSPLGSGRPSLLRQRLNSGVCVAPRAASSPLGSGCLYGASTRARIGAEGAGEKLGGARRGWGCSGGLGVLGRNLGVLGIGWGVPGGAGGCQEELGDSLDGSKMPGWNRESISAGARHVSQHQSHPNWFLLTLLMGFCRAAVSETPLWFGHQTHMV